MCITINYKLTNNVYNIIFYYITIKYIAIDLVYQVNADDTKECCSSEEKAYPLPPVYCYSGSEKSVLNVFQTITVCLIIKL